MSYTATVLPYVRAIVSPKISQASLRKFGRIALVGAGASAS